jgi:hypothetical protein
MVVHQQLSEIFPRIREDYQECGVDVGRIIRFMIRHAPKGCLDGLDAIEIIDSSPEGRGFACYYKQGQRIQLFVQHLIGWQPWLLRKSVFFPYLVIGLALGHEIDHHVNRNNEKLEKEPHAEANAFDYIYPFFFVTGPIKTMLTFLRRRHR